MKNESNNDPMLYKNIPAVAALNQVPGFDPLKLLRRTKAVGTQEPIMRLDLPYKKLWFRLANPGGRIRLNALRITEQLAICEAQIYLNRDDAQPAGSFTASCTKENAPDGKYIEAAQREAINEALSDAGYGLQFVDVTMRPEDRLDGSEIPAAAAKTVTPPAKAAAPTAAPVPQSAAPLQSAGKPERLVHMPAASQESLGAMVPTAAVDATPATVDVHPEEAPAQPALAVDISPVSADAEASVSPTAKPAVPAYTQESPVEEILRHMTLEQALDFVVDTGICNGWTLREVAQKRAVSLKHYIFGGYKGNNNILRAAARLVYDMLNEQKAA